LFCIALLARIQKEERRRRAWTEMKANGNFQFKNNLEKKFIKKTISHETSIGKY
jgi:hypothetical protein